jgi:hypothetical protein
VALISLTYPPTTWYQKYFLNNEMSIAGDIVWFYPTVRGNSLHSKKGRRRVKGRVTKVMPSSVNVMRGTQKFTVSRKDIRIPSAPATHNIVSQDTGLGISSTSRSKRRQWSEETMASDNSAQPNEHTTSQRMSTRSTKMDATTMKRLNVHAKPLKLPTKRRGRTSFEHVQSQRSMSETMAETEHLVELIDKRMQTISKVTYITVSV